MECKGVNGTVEFDGTFVTIKRTGALGRLTVGKGEKRIPLGQVVAVQWKEPGAMVRGFISFTITGAQENKRGFGKQTIDAAKDENAVIVAKSQAEEFRKLRAIIEEAVAAREIRTSTAGSVSASALSTADELAKLAQLRDQGVLSQEEFDAQKAKLLG